MFENFDSHKEAIVKLMKFVREKNHIDDVYRTNSIVDVIESESQEDYSYKLLPLENRERLEITKIEKEEKKSENDCPIDESVKPIKNPQNPPPFHMPIGNDTTKPYAKPYVDSTKPYSNPNNSEHQTVENIVPERLKLTNYSCENILPANLFEHRTNYSKTSDGILQSNLFDYRTNY